MVAKKAIYAVYGPEFKGIVRAHKEYKEKVNGKKKTFGKKCGSVEEAQHWLDSFSDTLKKMAHKAEKIEGYYAVHGPQFKGVVTTLTKFKSRMTGQKNTFGKKFTSDAEAQYWLDNFVGPVKKISPPPQPVVAEPTVKNVTLHHIPPTQEVVIYIDGGFKDGIGKYGIVAYSPKKSDRIYQDFGFVYDQQFNNLKNTGAELMACLRALEWAFSNGMKTVHIIYDYEGVADHLAKAQSNSAMHLYQNMIAGFQQHLYIHFLHVRHGNKEFHKQAHNLTQLSL
ncbi:reverse transcriptase-like protein [Solibacillus sp. FSL H8-0538]|uniref:reverse transcriptase-like protein n=1 Tax=Solibacillus sp. FSL H8-0538 TaxID=2921400 RepID=UPI0030FB19F7